jgi:hypothetical protein
MDLGENVFVKAANEEKACYSIDIKKIFKIMDSEFEGEFGMWMTLLPFRIDC